MTQNKRSQQFHRKYFALIKTGFEVQKYWANIENFRRSVLCNIGFIGIIESKEGVKYWDARSLSYEKCTQKEMEEVYKKTVTYFIEKLAINQEILSKVMSYE